jgi:F-type H+-transporting ATPase subunit b
VLIDWFTVGAQALNFIILVWLLKRFLYKPIRDAIDARETLIAKELAAAAAKETAAQKQSDELRHKNDEFDRQRAALLDKATSDASAQRERLLDEARQAADALSATRAQSLRSEIQNLSMAVSLRTQQEVFAIARSALTELAGASLEERVCEVFARRLRALDGEAKKGLAAAVKVSKTVLVRSAFDLPARQRAEIQSALNQTLAADVPIQFETAPDLVSGIELSTHGQKVSWSIAGYLSALSEAVEELVKVKSVAADSPRPGDRHE